MKNFLLTADEQRLVEENLDLVKTVIRQRIRTNEQIYGLGFDELMQEGSILLCRAASTFDPSRADFSTYAKKVIYNGLISHCRKVYLYESKFTSMLLDESGVPIPISSTNGSEDTFATRVRTVEVLDMLSFYAEQYDGVTKRGIDAMAKKIQGMTVTEIAMSLDVPPSHVGAWISKAVKALRANKEFMNTIC